MYDHVLVPTDGSDASRPAVEHAVELASKYDATLHVLYVLDVGELPPTFEDDAVHDAFQDRAERALDRVTELAAEAGIATVERSIYRGQPHEAILDYADEHGIDLIVMGTHGRTGIDRLLLGSVAEKVVRLAEVPVMTVHAPGTDEGGDEAATAGDA